jgi:hypothetical protein
MVITHLHSARQLMLLYLLAHSLQGIGIGMPEYVEFSLEEVCMTITCVEPLPLVRSKQLGLNSMYIAPPTALFNTQLYPSQVIMSNVHQCAPFCQDQKSE